MAKGSKKGYLNDYEVIPYVGANGKSKQKLRYVGEWYCIEESAEADRKCRTLHILSYLVSAAILATLLLNHSAYLTMYVAVPAVIALFPMLYLLMGSFRLPWKNRPLRHDEHDRSLARMWHSAVGILVVFAATAVGYLVFRIVGDGSFFWQDVLFLCCLVIVLLGSWFLYRIGKSVPVEKRPNDAFPTLFL